jgi:hypothetical protein
MRKMLSKMDYVKKYTDFKFWQIIIYGGIIVCLFVICFMFIGFFLGVISDYGRIFAFASSMFVCVLYVYLILLYFPIKILSDLYTLKTSMKLKSE